MIRGICTASLLLAFSVAACASDSTLKGAFEAQMKDNGYDGCLSIECAGVPALKKSIEFLTPLL